MLWDSKKQPYKEIFFLNFQQVTINVYWQKETYTFSSRKLQLETLILNQTS